VTFRHIQIRILVELIRGRKFATFMKFSCRFILAPRPRQSQPKLIVRLAALRFEPQPFLELSNCQGRLTILEKRLAQFPVIGVPTITLEGDANGAPHPEPSAYAKMFSGKYAHRTITGGIGHNLPQEAPQAFAQAVIDVAGY